MRRRILLALVLLVPSCVDPPAERDYGDDIENAALHRCGDGLPCPVD